MDKKNLEHFFMTKYAAVIADNTQCRAFLGNSQSLIVGFLFSDPNQNYHFLSECDMQAFPNETANDIRCRQQSPFAEMLLIFYSDTKGTACKLVNGMGSRLLLEAQRFCSS